MWAERARGTKKNIFVIWTMRWLDNVSLIGRRMCIKSERIVQSVENECCCVVLLSPTSSSSPSSCTRERRRRRKMTKRNLMRCRWRYVERWMLCLLRRVHVTTNEREGAERRESECVFFYSRSLSLSLSVTLSPNRCELTSHINERFLWF